MQQQAVAVAASSSNSKEDDDVSSSSATSSASVSDDDDRDITFDPDARRRLRARAAERVGLKLSPDDEASWLSTTSSDSSSDNEGVTEDDEEEDEKESLRQLANNAAVPKRGGLEGERALLMERIMPIPIPGLDLELDITLDQARFLMAGGSFYSAKLRGYVSLYKNAPPSASDLFGKNLLTKKLKLEEVPKADLEQYRLNELVASRLIQWIPFEEFCRDPLNWITLPLANPHNHQYFAQCWRAATQLRIDGPTREKWMCWYYIYTFLERSNPDRQGIHEGLPPYLMCNTWYEQFMFYYTTYFARVGLRLWDSATNKAPFGLYTDMLAWAPRLAEATGTTVEQIGRQALTQATLQSGTLESPTAAALMFDTASDQRGVIPYRIAYVQPPELELARNLTLQVLLKSTSPPQIENLFVLNGHLCALPGVIETTTADALAMHAKISYLDVEVQLEGLSETPLVYRALFTYRGAAAASPAEKQRAWLRVLSGVNLAAPPGLPYVRIVEALRLAHVDTGEHIVQVQVSIRTQQEPLRGGGGTTVRFIGSHCGVAVPIQFAVRQDPGHDAINRRFLGSLYEEFFLNHALVVYVVPSDLLLTDTQQRANQLVSSGLAIRAAEHLSGSSRASALAGAEDVPTRTLTNQEYTLLLEALQRVNVSRRQVSNVRVITLASEPQSRLRGLAVPAGVQELVAVRHIKPEKDPVQAVRRQQERELQEQAAAEAAAAFVVKREGEDTKPQVQAPPSDLDKAAAIKEYSEQWLVAWHALVKERVQRISFRLGPSALAREENGRVFYVRQSEEAVDYRRLQQRTFGYCGTLCTSDEECLTVDLAFESSSQQKTANLSYTVLLPEDLTREPDVEGERHLPEDATSRRNYFYTAISETPGRERLRQYFIRDTTEKQVQQVPDLEEAERRLRVEVRGTATGGAYRPLFLDGSGATVAEKFHKKRRGGGGAVASSADADDEQLEEQFAEEERRLEAEQAEANRLQQELQVAEIQAKLQELEATKRRERERLREEAENKQLQEAERVRLLRDAEIKQLQQATHLQLTSSTVRNLVEHWFDTSNVLMPRLYRDEMNGKLARDSWREFLHGVFPDRHKLGQRDDVKALWLCPMLATEEAMAISLDHRKLEADKGADPVSLNTQLKRTSLVDPLMFLRGTRDDPQSWPGIFALDGALESDGVERPAYNNRLNATSTQETELSRFVTKIGFTGISQITLASRTILQAHLLAQRAKATAAVPSAAAAAAASSASAASRFLKRGGPAMTTAASSSSATNIQPFFVTFALMLDRHPDPYEYLEATNVETSGARLLALVGRFMNNVRDWLLQQDNYDFLRRPRGELAGTIWESRTAQDYVDFVFSKTPSTVHTDETPLHLDGLQYAGDVALLRAICQTYRIRLVLFSRLAPSDGLPSQITNLINQSSFTQLHEMYNLVIYRYIQLLELTPISMTTQLQQQTRHIGWYQTLYGAVAFPTNTEDGVLSYKQGDVLVLDTLNCSCLVPIKRYSWRKVEEHLHRLASRQANQARARLLAQQAARARQLTTQELNEQELEIMRVMETSPEELLLDILPDDVKARKTDDSYVTKIYIDIERAAELLFNEPQMHLSWDANRLYEQLSNMRGVTTRGINAHAFAKDFITVVIDDEQMALVNSGLRFLRLRLRLKNIDAEDMITEYFYKNAATGQYQRVSSSSGGNSKPSTENVTSASQYQRVLWYALLPSDDSLPDGSAGRMRARYQREKPRMVTAIYLPTNILQAHYTWPCLVEPFPGSDPQYQNAAHPASVQHWLEAFNKTHDGAVRIFQSKLATLHSEQDKKRLAKKAAAAAAASTPLPSQPTAKQAATPPTAAPSPPVSKAAAQAVRVHDLTVQNLALTRSLKPAPAPAVRLDPFARNKR